MEEWYPGLALYSLWRESTEEQAPWLERHGISIGQWTGWIRQHKGPTMASAGAVAIATGGRVDLWDWLPPTLRDEVLALPGHHVGMMVPLDVLEEWAETATDEQRAEATRIRGSHGMRHMDRFARLHILSGGAVPLCSWLDPEQRVDVLAARAKRIAEDERQPTEQEVREETFRRLLPTATVRRCADLGWVTFQDVEPHTWGEVQRLMGSWTAARPLQKVMQAHGYPMADTSLRAALAEIGCEAHMAFITAAASCGLRTLDDVLGLTDEQLAERGLGPKARKRVKQMRELRRPNKPRRRRVRA